MTGLPATPTGQVRDQRGQITETSAATALVRDQRDQDRPMHRSNLHQKAPGGPMG